MLLALDPGIRGVGVALFEGGRLVACAYLRNPVSKGDEPAAVVAVAREAFRWAEGLGFDTAHEREIVIEWPRVYVAGKSPGDNNDLLALPAIGCALAAFAYPAPVSRFKPDEWKGQLDKEPTARRVWDRLDERERAIALAGAERAKSKDHNMIDAIGIGLKRVGRFERKRVIAR